MWLFSLLLYHAYCECCCSEHGRAGVSLTPWFRFFWTDTQEEDCWTFCLSLSLPPSFPLFFPPPPSLSRFELASLCLYSWLTMGCGGVLFCLESLSSLLASRHPCNLCALILLYHRLVACLAELRPYYFWPITLTVKKALLLAGLGSSCVIEEALTLLLAFKWLCKLSSPEWKHGKDGSSVLLTRSKLQKQARGGAGRKREAWDCIGNRDNKIGSAQAVVTVLH